MLSSERGMTLLSGGVEPTSAASELRFRGSPKSPGGVHA
jgi:hypothetical protein